MADASPKGFYEKQACDEGNAADRNMRPQSLGLPWHCGAFCPFVSEQMGEAGYCGALRSTASYLVNGFVDKSSHLPDKDGLQKVTWGATLPFAAV